MRAPESIAANKDEEKHINNIPENTNLKKLNATLDDIDTYPFISKNNVFEIICEE